MALLAVYLLLRWLLPGSPWWLDLFDTFALYLFVPLLLLLLLALLFLSGRTLLACAFPVAVFAVLYGNLFLPQPKPPATTETTFTVMTFNVLEMNRSIASIVQLLRDERPDVVGFQELTPEIATPLASRLANDYPYRALELREDRSSVGVFSRFPIKTREAFIDDHATGNQYQHLVLDVNGRDVHLFNVHPNHPFVKWARQKGFPPFVIQRFDTERQTLQVESIVAQIEKVDGPTVVLGDFNLTDQTRQYRRITRNLVDSYREAGSGFGHTFPANGRIMHVRMPFPVVRIDYVFHSRALVAVEAHRGDNAGSDHYPVIVTLGIER